MMSHRFPRTAAALVLVCGLSAGPARADDFKLFWSAFAKAAANNDKAALQTMIKYPFFDGEIRQAGEFDTIYKRDFGPKARACLAKAKPQKDKDGDGKETYAVFCGDRIYSFTREGEAWRLSDLGVND